MGVRFLPGAQKLTVQVDLKNKKLIIELDGPTHARASRRERDEFIDAALNGTGLPILHIPVGPYTSESIKKAVGGALAKIY